MRSEIVAVSHLEPGDRITGQHYRDGSGAYTVHAIKPRLDGAIELQYGSMVPKTMTKTFLVRRWL